MLRRRRRRQKWRNRSKPTICSKRSAIWRRLAKLTCIFAATFSRRGLRSSRTRLSSCRPWQLAAKKSDRLDLARWMVAKDNPLTARVIVNRIWQLHFGRGIVPTVDDFGTQGDPPSHPELLDWLASDLRDNGWTLKRLHRLIVTSATYRQSAAARPELVHRDPYNQWLARQNRLRVEAEIVRDLALTSAGLLNPAVGGPSVRPPQPPGVSDLTYAGSTQWAESTGPDRYRRGLYIWFQRTSPYPSLTTFDAPESILACTRRDRSDTPLQALTLLNDVVFVECSHALGQRIFKSETEQIAIGERRWRCG